MDVFLSYANADREIASRLAKDLNAQGIEVWQDIADIKPGEVWVQSLLNAIRNAPNFVAIVSKNTLTRPYFSTELATAIAASQTSNSRRILPVLIEKGVRIPPFLSQFKALDATTPEHYQAAVRELAQLIKGEPNLGKPLPPPDELERYNRVVPELAEQILEMAQSEQIRRLEQERQGYLLGRILGLVAFCSLIAISVVAYTVGSPVFLALIGAVLTGLISSFVAGFFAAKFRGMNAGNDREAAHGD